MILVVGSALDSATRDLVRAWSGSGALLLSAEDLCTSGWEFSPLAAGAGFFVAEGAKRAVAGVRGVIVRRPAVTAEELPWIAADDRRYVAAEINAFLVAWLAALPCVVLNRPTPTSLCGPAWSQSHWRIAAARGGLRWSVGDGESALVDVVVCGDAQQGAASDEQRRAGRALAQLSGTELLGVRFRADGIAAVTLQPQLLLPAVREMVLSRLAGAALS